MSAKVPSCLPLKELVKYSGYECGCDMRAECCMTHKLYCWCEEGKDNNYIYTQSNLPQPGDIWLYSATAEGLLDVMHFDSEWVITEESMTYRGVKFVRVDYMDIDL